MSYTGDDGLELTCWDSGNVLVGHKLQIMRKMRKGMIALGLQYSVFWLQWSMRGEACMVMVSSWRRAPPGCCLVQPQTSAAGRDHLAASAHSGAGCGSCLCRPLKDDWANQYCLQNPKAEGKSLNCLHIYLMSWESTRRMFIEECSALKRKLQL